MATATVWTGVRRWLAFFAFSFSLFAQDAELEHARRVNLERDAAMPNFVADEISQRFTRRTGSSEWRHADTLEAEIAVKGTVLSRQHWRRNGKPWKPDSGFIPGAGFGAELKPLFSPECPTMLHFSGREEAGGKPVLSYTFSSPPDGCFFALADREHQYNAARTGRVFVDAPLGNLIRFEEEATGFPAGFAFVQRNQVVSWDALKIGDASYWLPAAADFVWRLPPGQLYRVSIEYKNHRHFEAASHVTFK